MDLTTCPSARELGMRTAASKIRCSRTCGENNQPWGHPVAFARSAPSASPNGRRSEEERTRLISPLSRAEHTSTPPKLGAMHLRVQRCRCSAPQQYRHPVRAVGVLLQQCPVAASALALRLAAIRMPLLEPARLSRRPSAVALEAGPRALQRVPALAGHARQPGTGTHHAAHVHAGA